MRRAAEKRRNSQEGVDECVFYDIDKLVCIREYLDRWSKCLLRVQACAGVCISVQT